MHLKRRHRYSTFIEQVHADIATGLLVAGDRLLSYADLIKTYGISQMSVQKGLDALVKQGLVTREERKGCFIAEGALERLQALRPAAAAAPALDATQRHAWLAYAPPREKPSLTLSSMDGNPEVLAVWRSILGRYTTATGCAIHFAPTTILTDTASMTAADIIQTTPLILQSLGVERYLAFPDFGVLGMTPPQLCPAFQRFAKAYPRAPYVPFQMMPHVVVGQTALFADPKAVRSAASVGQLLAALGAYDQRRYRCGLGSVSLLLCAEGSLTFQRHTGTCALHEGKARRTLHAMARFANPFLAATYSVPEYLQWSPAFHLDFLFNVRHLQRHTSAPLFCRDLPVTAHGTATMVPIILAIRKDSAHVGEALGLVEHLCSKEIQREFALLGEALPARNDVASLPDVIAANPLPRTAQQRLCRHGELLSDASAELWGTLSGIDAIGHAMLRGRLSPDAALNRIALLCTSSAITPHRHKTH